MTKDEALKMALEALEGFLDNSPIVLKGSISGGLYEVIQCRDAITAIKEALAQQEQEPVCDKDPQGCWNVRCQLGKKCKNTPPQRTWVGLTDEEITQIIEMGLGIRDSIETAESKLKDKNL